MRRALLYAVLLITACERSKPAPPLAAADAARAPDAGMADAAPAPDAAPIPDAAVPDAVPPPAVPAELGLRGCLGISPDGRAAMLAFDETTGDDPEGDFEVARSFDVVTLPGADTAALPSGASLGSCKTSGSKPEGFCDRGFAESGRESLPDVVAGLRKARWTPCVEAARVGNRWELPVGRRRVSFGVRTPRHDYGGSPAFARAFAAPHSDNVFIVYSEGEVWPPLEKGAVITPEEMGQPRCLPRGKAVASLLPPSQERFDLAAADSRCRLVHPGGRHALFTTEEQKCTDDGDCTTRIAHDWIGEPLASLPRVYPTSLEKNKDYGKMFRCEPIPDTESAPTHMLVDQSRVWIKVPGQEPRWIVTLHGEHQSVPGVYTGGPATTLFYDVFFDAREESHTDPSFATLDDLGLGACPPASQPTTQPAR